MTVLKKLAVFFPGIGYTVDRPLLYYTRRIAEKEGYDIKLLPYGGFPAKIMGDAGRMEESFRIALSQSVSMLSDVQWEKYASILFAGKSVGTAVAARLAESSAVKDRISLLLYTPLEYTFSYRFGKAFAFTGSSDPWVGKEKSRIPGLCSERNIPCMIIPGGNHSLECGDVMTDIGNLQRIMETTGDFVKSL